MTTTATGISDSVDPARLDEFVGRFTGRGTMRRKLVTAASILGLTVFFGWAPAAHAHEGHGSCGPGYKAAVVPLAQSGDAGEIVSFIARAGGVNETVAGLHSALCEPRP